MRTSIIISSIAALLLLVTFAETPSGYVTNGVSKSKNNDISFIHVNGIMPLAKTNIPTLKKETSATIPAIPIEDYSYLKFDVSNYMTSDATMEAYDLLPALPLNDYNYLKFDVNEYMVNSEFTDSEIFELPKNEFASLRFDVTDYYTTGEIETVEMHEHETGTNYKSNTSVSGEEINEFSYLKFDVNNYYNAKNTRSEYELPE